MTASLEPSVGSSILSGSTLICNSSHPPRYLTPARIIASAALSGWVRTVHPTALAAVEVRIQAVLLQEHYVVAALRDAASLYNEDQVGVPDSAQAVGDDDARPALQQRGQGSLDDRLRARVYVARRLVQDEDARVCQDRPGKRE